MANTHCIPVQHLSDVGHFPRKYQGLFAEYLEVPGMVGSQNLI